LPPLLYLPFILFFPAFLSLLAPLIPDSANGKLLHRFAIIGSLILLLVTLLPLFTLGTVPLETALAAYTFDVPWLPFLGIHFSLAMDGISFTLVVLTAFLLLMAVVASMSTITHRLKLYYSMLFLMITAVLGVFLARDFFLFLVSYELELIPMYLLIAIWGGPRREYAAIKFVLYTLFGSIFLIAGVLALYYFAATSHLPGVDGTNLFLLETAQKLVASGNLPLLTQVLIFSSLFIGFSVKLPVVPFHTWLPDAHGEAPTPISMLLAGILLKMGAYGMLRFCFGLFPLAATEASAAIALLAFINIVYTAGVALVQKDMKRLIAYSSVSHMGFVILGLAALNATGFNGAMFVMLSHGIVSAALFMCVGTLYLRTHTRLIADYQGASQRVPVIYYFFLFMAMSSLGLPFLISFAGESLVMYGAYLSNAFDGIRFTDTLILPWSIQTITVLSALGIIIGAAYLLWLLQRVFCGPLLEKLSHLKDATRSEVFVLTTMSILVIAFGLFPQALVSQFEPAVTRISKPFSHSMTTGRYVLSQMNHRVNPSLDSKSPDSGSLGSETQVK
jgi:NADH-quinone oxidoreductase subunit M